MNTYEITRRPDYELGNMQRVFQVLEAFDITFTKKQKLQADKLFCCIDFADQLIDSNRISREDLLDLMINNQKEFPNHIPNNVMEVLKFTKNLIQKNKVCEQLKAISEELFAVNRQLGSTYSSREYVHLTIKEGRSHAELGILLIGKEFSINVIRFLTEANVLGNLCDNLIDLEEDSSAGRISISPRKIGLKLRLRLSLLISASKLFYHYPKKLEALRLAKKYIKYALLNSFETKR